MSENLDLVRSIYADWERGDWTHTEWAHPEIEYVIPDGPAPGRWTGLAGMATAWRDMLGAWTDLQSRAECYRELDEERVLVLPRFSTRGRASGVDLPETLGRHAALFHINSGRVIRLVFYWDRERALADLGLER